MRVTILFAVLLCACTSTAKPGAPAAATDRGFVQEVDGHYFAVIMQGDAALVFPIDRTPAMLATGVRGGKVTGTVTAVGPRDLGRFTICPCCAQRCNNCQGDLIGAGCHPGLDVTKVLDLLDSPDRGTVGDPPGATVEYSRGVARPAEVPLDDDRAALAAIERADWRAATVALMARHGAAIYRYCRQMVGDDALAEDLQQHVFVTAYRDLPTFAARSSVKTWLYGIARHRCLDAIKMRRRREQRFVADDDAAEAAEDTSTPGALARFAHGQLATALTDCLDELAPAVRDAVLLRYREDFQYEEISELCGDKPGTLQQRVARALPVLRRCLERRLGEGAAP